MAKQNNQPLPMQILTLIQGAKDPLSSNDLLDALYLNKKDKDTLYKALDALSGQGLIERIRGNRYAATKTANRQGPFLYKGTFSAHPKGFGFFMTTGPANEEDLIPVLKEDAFVPPPARRGALHGDGVTALVSKGRDGRYEATIASVTTRARTRFSGILRQEGARQFVEPEDGRLPGRILVDQILVTPEPLAGQAVIVEMTQFPRGEDLHMKGNIVFLHAEQTDPRTEVDRLIALHNLPASFPADVEAEAANAPQEVKAEDFPDRLDLRELPLVTIDGEDARDFDDAVAVIELSHGYELTVAIADVSHYVRVGSALDREAFERGTSVYFPDRVIPMLPHALSNGICSLNPAVNRLCMVAIIELDKQGRVMSSRFDKAIMNSHGRLTYEAVTEVLEDKPGWQERHPALVHHKERLHLMSRVSQLLRALRMQRGSLDFDLPEAQIVFDRTMDDQKADAQNLIKDIIERPRAEANKLIEDFMLAANEAVAAVFTKHKIPAPYRIHEPPDATKLETFATLSTRLGQPLELGEEITPKQLGVYLESLSAKPALAILHQLLLRSLKQAKYSTQNVGHFGLAAQDYLHFTSPIRRYPDLIVHRVLASFLGQKKGFAPATKLAPIKDLEAVSVQSSQRERRSFEAERDVDDMWRAYYMSRHLGETFDGKISGVTKSGFFVTIPKPYVDGFVRAESLPGLSFSTDENNIQLISGSGYTYSLGDEVRVKVVRTSWRERKIDLELVAHDAKTPPPDKPKQKKAGSREQTATHRDDQHRGRRNSRGEQSRDKKAGTQPKPGKGKKGPTKSSPPKQNRKK